MEHPKHKLLDVDSILRCDHVVEKQFCDIFVVISVARLEPHFEVTVQHGVVKHYILFLRGRVGSPKPLEL